ncbi:MAG TPA: hypothetical protein PK684_09320, partial [Bacillota bacterium]|nr:hypothetical protein [Bacillota bacterium]
FFVFLSTTALDLMYKIAPTFTDTASLYLLFVFLKIKIAPFGTIFIFIVELVIPAALFYRVFLRIGP